jgi:hypothetical protein
LFKPSLNIESGHSLDIIDGTSDGKTLELYKKKKHMTPQRRMQEIMMGGFGKQTLNNKTRMSSKTRVGVECANPIQPSKKNSGYNWKKTYSLV